MERFLKTITRVAGVAVIGTMTAIGPVQTAFAQAPAAQSQKKVKDQGEYDLFNAVVKEQDQNKKLSLLDQWKQKYPDSDFKLERLQYYLQTYQKLNQTAKMVDTAKQILALEPKDIQALYWISFLTPTLGSNSPDVLDTAEKAANGLLSAERPAAVKEEDWAKSKKDLEALAHKTLGWIAMVRKNNEVAQQEFTKSLQINPHDGQISYWLGTVILAQKKPELQSQALYNFARAAAYEGQGSLNPQGRQQVDDYLQKAYTQYHGQQPSLADLKTMAKSQALPSADFKIKTKEEIEVEQENQLRESNPALALWLNLKKELTGPDGTAFFDKNMKGANVPGGVNGIQKFSGKLVEAKPAVRSKELLVSIAGSGTPDVILKLDTPLSGKPELGGTIEFDGVPTAYTPDPFMVNFDVEQAKINGLKVEKPTPVRRPVRRKKG